MLFVIENCKPDEYGKDINRSLALSNILRSHGLRFNLVFSEAQVMQAVIDSNIYGSPEKKFAVDVKEMAREVGALRKKLDVYTVVDFNCTAFEARFDSDRGAIIAGYMLFVSGENVGPVKLICENRNDYEFYMKLADFYSYYDSKIGLSTKLSFLLGAGSHSKVEFDQHEAEGKFVLCIVDSDKVHPNSARGSTSASFTKQNEGYHKAGKVHVLERREAESLLPISLVEEIVYNKIPDKSDVVEEIKIYHHSDTKFSSYFDFKDGLTLKNAIEMDNKYGIFWTRILGHNSKFHRHACFQKRDCYSCSSCPKVEGISNDILRHGVDKLHEMHLRQLKDKMDEALREEWGEIGSLLMSWGCSIGDKAVRS